MIDDDAFDAVMVLAHAHRLQGDAARSALLLSALDRLRPDQPPLLRALAAAELARGQASAALQALDRLALLGAVDGSFHLLRAQALVAAGRAEEAHSAMSAYLTQRNFAAQGAA
jgi:Flp pilus assembly protein TadD